MIIALNNKSNLNRKDFKEYYKELLKIKTKSKLILCPTFLNIGLAYSDKVLLGSQNVSRDKDGAFMSVEELKLRAGIGKSTVEILQNAGCLKGMTWSNQMSLFAI